MCRSKKPLALKRETKWLHLQELGREFELIFEFDFKIVKIITKYIFNP